VLEAATRPTHDRAEDVEIGQQRLPTLELSLKAEAVWTPPENPPSQ
jgi:hypothetical protein